MILNSTTLAKTLFDKPELIFDLENILGTNPNGDICKISFQINTDRAEPMLSSKLIETSDKINSVSKILGVVPSDLKLSFDYHNSDHRSTSHILNLNNNLTEGAIAIRKGKLFQLNHFNANIDIYGKWQLEDLENGDKQYYSVEEFEVPCNWHFILNFISSNTA